MDNNEAILPREQPGVGGEQREPQQQQQQQQQRTLKSKLITSARLVLIASLALHLAMFIVGILGVKKCPVNDNIPLFLIATGILGLMSKLLTTTREYVTTRSEVRLTPLESSLYSGELIFLILGAYWVFKVYPPSYEPTEAGYCDKSTYLFAFVYLSLVGGLLLAAAAGFLFFLACLCWLSSLSAEGAAGDVEAGRQQD